MNHTSTLNKAQSVANRDGTYTFVLSRQDPGVHNWIDPCGLGEGILTLRMAEFPGSRPKDDLSAQSRVVPLSRLRDELPTLRLMVDAAAGGFRAKMKRADRSRAELAVIIGEDEHRDGAVSVKALRSNEAQAHIPQRDLVTHLRATLAP